MLKCNRCDLGCDGHLDGYDPHVPGQGNPNSKIMFVAEAPGKQETIHRKPLTPPGASGKMYEKVLDTLGMRREDVFTTNVVSCRPPCNRDPEVWEIHKCKPFLDKQISIIQPKIIVTFGRFAAQNFTDNFKITRDHGTLIKSKYSINMYSLYHPAYVSAYAPRSKRMEFKQDVIKLKEILKDLKI